MFSPWIRRLLRPELLIVVLTFIVYAQSLGNVFVAYDDELLIGMNEKVHGLTRENVRAAFTTYDPELYVPLTLLTYQIEYALFGLNPTVFHLTSLLLHIGSALLVFRIFAFFFTRRIALICALLFALHPMNVEAVAWASGRKDVLSAFFFLLSVWSSLRWRGEGRGYALSLGAFLCALLSKASVLPLPFILLLLDWLQGRRIDWPAVREKIPYIVLAIVFFIVALIGKTDAGDVRTWVLLGLVGIPFHLGKYLLPVNLSVFYPFTGSVSVTDPQILGGIVAILLLGAIAVRSLRRTRWIMVGGLWYLALIVPALPALVKAGDDDAVMLFVGSDRYAYLAGLGMLLLLGAALTRIRGGLWQRAGVVVVLLASIATYRQSLVWRDSVALFSRVVMQERPAPLAYRILGDIAAERRDFDTAIALYEASLDISPSSRALLNLGRIYALQGKRQEAAAAFERVLDLRPGDALARQLLEALR